MHLHLENAAASVRTGHNVPSTRADARIACSQARLTTDSRTDSANPLMNGRKNSLTVGHYRQGASDTTGSVEHQRG
jgi:hypothetical protein